MDVSDRFLRFAAECEVMAKSTPSPANKVVWRRIAERWVRCAQWMEQRNSLAQTEASMKRHRKPAKNLLH